MRKNVSIQEPHIILFLTDMEEYGRSIIKLGSSLFEVTPRKDRYIISGLTNKGREEILFVTLEEIFELPFEVLELGVLNQLYDKV